MGVDNVYTPPWQSSWGGSRTSGTGCVPATSPGCGGGGRRARRAVMVEESFVHKRFVTLVFNMIEENKSGMLKYNRGLMDFEVVVEESFWHKEYVTGSTIVMENTEGRRKISQEVSHADRKSAMHFRSQTCSQGVSCAVKKLAMQTAMKKSAMQEQLKFQEERNTRRQIKEYVAGVATNMVYITWMKERLIRQYKEYTREVDVIRIEVYLMRMEDRLIYLYKKYAWQENIIMIEVYWMQLGERLIVKDNDMGIMIISKVVEVIKVVFNMMEYNKEKFTIQEGDIRPGLNMIEDTNMKKVVNFKSVEVVGTVIIKEGNIIQLKDTNLVSMIAIETGVVFMTVVNKMEYNTAEMKKKLIVKERDINMKNMVYIKFLEMVETVVNTKEYNTAVMHEEITVKEEKGNRKSEDFWSFRNIRQDTVLSGRVREIVGSQSSST
jgi:hypothetical protein